LFCVYKHNAMKRFSKLLLSLFGLLFGFATPVLAQYGAPIAHFKIKGKILDNCGRNMPNVEIIQEPTDRRYSKYTSKTLVTDSNGAFVINYAFHWTELQLRIEADIDKQYKGFDTILSVRNYIPNKELTLVLQTNRECSEVQKDEDSISIHTLDIDAFPDTGEEVITDRKTTQENNPVKIHVFPNPTHDDIQCKLYVDAKEEEVYLALYSLSGQLLVEKKEKLNAGWNTIQFPLNHLARSIYVLKVESKSIRKHYQIIKK
jgi:putative lipoprotein (rSAM/lipoprotein system)